MKTKTAVRPVSGPLPLKPGMSSHEAGVHDAEWEKLKPVIFRLFLQLHNGTLD